jgi:hypothetical protein
MRDGVPRRFDGRRGCEEAERVGADDLRADREPFACASTRQRDGRMPGDVERLRQSQGDVAHRFLGGPDGHG